MARFRNRAQRFHSGFQLTAPLYADIREYRFATTVFSPARSLDFARDDGAKCRYAWFAGGRGRPAPTYSTESKHRHRRLAHRGSLFAPARSLDFARDDGAMYRYAWFAGGRGRPPLPILQKVSTGIADLPTGAHRRMNEERRDILKPSPLGARRGGAKHRKNSPQVTVFSQSGEATVLRAGRWIAEAIA